MRYLLLVLMIGFINVCDNACCILQYRQNTTVVEHHPTCIRILRRRKKTEPSYLESPELEETRRHGFYGR